MSSKAVVEIEKVSKLFAAGNHAVKDLSMDIKEGEFFSLLGPSGCGKTTLLRMIAGFEYPSSGKVMIAGQDVSRVPPHKRPVNMVFQSYALFPHLNIFDNVAFGLRMTSACPENEIGKRVEDALNLVRLSSFLNRYPRELSGGQQQRIAFARAIVNRPKVLLLDEPLSALDPKIRLEMQSELARFKKELNMTFVMVTHDQSEAFALSDRIAVLSQGHLEQLASAEEIFQQPKTPFVADFIGQTNLIEAEVLEIKHPFCLVLSKSGLKIKANASQIPEHELSSGRKVTIWMRSSAFSLSESASHAERSDETNIFEVEVIHRSFQGQSLDYHLKIAEEVFWKASIPNADDAPKAGQNMYLLLSARDAQVIPH